MILTNRGSDPKNAFEARARVLELADYLEYKIDPLTFYMGDWIKGDESFSHLMETPGTYCGTSACVAGHTVALFGHTVTKYEMSDVALKLLGTKFWNREDVLNSGEPKLFYCTMIEKPSEAARFLREIASRIEV